MVLTSRKIQAFTLAEVLIALTIVGIVAAMTIPTLIENQQKKIYTGNLKKTYSALQQAFQKEKMDQSSDYLFSLYGNTGEFLKKHFAVAKDCGTNPSGCFASSYKCLSYSTTYSLRTDSNSYSIITSDGASIKLFVNRENDGEEGIGTIYIDVNGLKGPNTYGRDFFNAYLYQDGYMGRNHEPLNKRMGGIVNGILYDGSSFFINASKLNCTILGGSVNGICFAYLKKNNWVMDY